MNQHELIPFQNKYCKIWYQERSDRNVLFCWVRIINNQIRFETNHSLIIIPLKRIISIEEVVT